MNDPRILKILHILESVVPDYKAPQIHDQNGDDLDLILQKLEFLKESSEAGKVTLNSNQRNEVPDSEVPLKSSDECYWKTILAHVPEIIVIFNQDFQITYVNQLLEGYDPEKVIGSNVFDFINPEEHQKMLAIYREIFATGKTVDYEISGPDFNQNIRYFRSTAGLIHHTAKEIIIITEDLSEMRNTDLELKKSKIRYKNLIENLNDAVIVDNLEGKILYANERFLNLFGFAVEDIQNLMIEDYVHEDDLPKVLDSHRRRIKGEELKDFIEFKGIMKDGSEKWLEARVSKVIENGVIVGTQAAIRDITNRKMIESNLMKLNEDLKIHSKELSVSNIELEQFAFVASHDLQEPLRMITSFLNLLEKKYDHLLDERGKKYIYFATDGAKRMQSIILNLLEYSRVGKTDERKEIINVTSLLQEIVHLNQGEIEKLGAEITWGNLPVISGEKTPIQQVFQNLISNGLKYQKPDSFPKIIVSAQELPDRWIFSIRDNGIGIEKEYHQKIFTLFHRLHNKEQYQGTGIGLAICKKTIENFGGEIWLESEVDQGSTFYFTHLKSESV